MTDSSGIAQAVYQYEPFGSANKLSGSLDADQQYGGYYTHPRSTLSLSQTRAYQSKLARWISRDLLEEVDSGPNLYSYVDNVPTGFTDPSGMLAGLVLFGIWIGEQALVNGTVIVGTGTLIGIGIGVGASGPQAVRGKPQQGQPGPVSTDPSHPTDTQGVDPQGAQDILNNYGKTGLDPSGPRDRCGKCPPCPPDMFWMHPGNEHGSSSGFHYHGIRWNQDANCRCWPKRVSGPTPHNMK